MNLKEKIREELIKDSVNWIYERPEVIPEDDDMISPAILKEIYSDSLSIIPWLKEDLEKSEFDNLQSTQFVFGMIQNEHVDDPQKAKPRPFICLYRTDGESIAAFQVTTSNKSPLYTYRLEDWQNYELYKPSYINIEHPVILNRREIKFVKAKCLTVRDVDGLIYKLKALSTHDKLTGYQGKYNIDSLVNYLETYKE